jgi:hypothetical protein
MIVRVFTGPTWSEASVLDDAEFDVLPRKGEKLALSRGKEWAVATVSEVAYRCTGHGAADVALLVGAVATSPLGDQDLPLAALDGDASTAPSVPRVERPGPWQ